MKLATDGMVSELLSRTQVPRMFHARQTFPARSIPSGDIPALAADLLSAAEISEKVKPGMRIGIAVGSRGIRNIDLIVKSIVQFADSKGAHPFVFPAMGSHGKATAQGQADILAGYGITERAVGCPIVSSMEVMEIGRSAQGRPVFMDRAAWESDGVIATCRVKPHTSFRGKVESGICKMLTVGMGKQAGASAVHAEGMEHMADTITDMAKTVIASGKVLFALPCIENAYDETEHLEAVLPEAILEREPELLQHAFSMMPRLLVGAGDVLVVDEIGKDYGGTGADPNITGRFPTPYASGGADVERVAFLNLSPGSHGNAMGCGLADVVTRKLYDAIDFDAMYANCMTSRVLASARMPCVLPTDRQAVQFCIKTCTRATRGSERVIYIANTLHIGNIMLSEAYYDAVRDHAYEGLEALDAPAPLTWDGADNLTTPVML